MSKRQQSKLDPLMEGYLEYRASVERRAPRTLKDIRCTLRRVTAAMERLRPGKPLWELKLTDFIAWLEQERQAGYSTRGLCKNVSHIRGFLNYAWRSGRCDRNVMSEFYPEHRCEQKEPESLTIKEALELVRACPATTRTERRDRVMILLLYGCGLRTGEVCSLKIRDVSTERHELHVKRAKGDIERIIPIPETVYTELLAHLLERGVKRGPVFVTTAKGRPVSQRVVTRVVREAAERAGIRKKVTPKTLRHSFATHLMDRGVDVAHISKLMGHAGPVESGVYLHVLPGRTRAAVEKLD